MFKLVLGLLTTLFQPKKPKVNLLSEFGLVLSRLDENHVNECTIGPRFSDHHVFECKRNIERPGEQKEVITTRKFRFIDPKGFLC